MSAVSLQIGCARLFGLLACRLSSDPKTDESMRCASDAWSALAQQSERAAFPLPRSAVPIGAQQTSRRVEII
jgi:hypothetical protein